MVPRRALALLVAPLAALALVTGCSRADDAAREAITEAILANQEAFGMDREQAECTADGLVDELGVDELRDAGLLDDEDAGQTPTMSRDQARDVSRVVVRCGEVKEQVLSQLPPETSADVRECADRALSEQVQRGYVAAILRDRRGVGERLVVEAVQGCLAEDVG